MKKKNILITEESEPNLPSDIILGKRYKIITLIGNGAIGKCFLVTDTYDHKEKIIKIIKNSALWEILSGNASLLKKIDHKNIVRTLGIKILNGYPCVIQEYIPGYNLEDLALSHPITLNICLQILEDILNALQYMNDLGISHKDIKPSNILYDSQNSKTTLVDLDYSVINEKTHKKYLGTIKYSAPEQVLQNYTSIKSDCYSLGLVLCYLIIGQLPFDVDLTNREYIIKQHLEKMIKSNPAYPCLALEKLYNLITSLLSFDYNKRITIDEALSLVKEIKNNITQTSPNIILRDTHTIPHNEPWKVFSTPSLLETTVIGLEPSFNYFNLSAISRVSNDTASIYNTLKKEQRADTYRSKLMNEYDNILVQAKISFGLWVTSILICFTMIIIAMYLIIKGEYIQGLFTALLDVFVLAIQKLFNIREDHYRKLIEQKMKHLEDGDYIEYAFEKAMMFENPKDRNREAMELLKQIKECTKNN